MAGVFTSQGSNDVADAAASGTLTGSWVSGSLAELVDSTGDFFYGIDGADYVRAGGGHDTFVNISGSVTIDNLFGGIDTLAFSNERSPFSTGFATYDLRQATLKGFDRLTFLDHQGSDSFFDTVTVQFAAAQIGLENLNQDLIVLGSLAPLATPGTDPASRIEVYMGSDVDVDLGFFQFSNWSANDVLTIFGDGDAEQIRGGQVRDSILAGAGDDTILTSAGNDSYDGGDGTDLVVFSNAIVGVGATVFLSAPTNQATQGANTYQLASIENIEGTSYSDLLVGNSVANSISGGDDRDVIYLLGGQDRGYGGKGDDVIVLGLGDDSAEGGSQSDYIYGGDGNDSILGDFATAGFLEFAGNDVLLGEGGNDTLDGNDGDDYLFGGTGMNTMMGGAGLDVFISEGIGDSLNGGSGHNFFYIFGSGTTATGGTDIDEFIGGVALSNDTFYGGGGLDYGYGGAGNDRLFGGDDNDVLIGEDGDDLLAGGAGVNLLWAYGSGNDTVLINAADGAQTQVIDFFEAGGVNDSVRIIGSNLTAFADYQTLVANMGQVVNGNILYNTGIGAQLYLNLGPNQVAIWFQGISPYALTASDFTFA